MNESLKKRLEPECIECIKQNYSEKEGYDVPCVRALALPYKYYEEILGCPIYRKAVVKIGESMALIIVEEKKHESDG